MIPKFRVWIKEDKKMFGVDELEFEDDADGNCGNLYRVIYPKYACKLESAEFPRDCILMQSTGLKDKNGKEIYEGDIIFSRGEYWRVGGDLSEGTILCYRGPYSFHSGRDSLSSLLKCNGDKNGGKIVGNIYENPELLEGKKCSK